MVAGVTVAIAPAHAADVNPYSPLAGHPYRHGAVPTLEAAQKMADYRAAHPMAAAAAGQNLVYGGAVDNIGVTTGKPRVYVVFWGSQWGAASTNSDGNTVFPTTGDPDQMAPRVQQLLKGIGTQGETWSGVMTQYCEGVPKGSLSCPASAAHVGYPTGGAFAGVWVDGAAKAPDAATEQQIGVEAFKAASHFGNTSPSLNRTAQYVVVSPHGTHPDGFGPSGGFCAWHDWTGDTTLTPGPPTPPTPTFGQIAFTNLPYVTDVGASCGENFVNKTGTSGRLDGVTIVEGHEYAETISDQNPPGGWVDTGGEENADKCAWISTGTGASANVQFATGSFAMQSTWANDASSGQGGCIMSHAIIGGNNNGTDFGMAVSPSTAAVTSGTSHTVTVTVSTKVIAGSPGTVKLTLGKLPTGTTATLSPTSVAAGGTSTLTLKTTSSTPIGNYQVAVIGTAGSIVRQAVLQLAVYKSTGSVSNGSFERGLFSWTTIGTVAVVSDPVHSGLAAARIGIRSQPTSGPAVTSTLRKTFTIRTGHSHLTLWYEVICTDQVISDWFTITLKDNTAGGTKTLLGRTCRQDSAYRSLSTSVIAGHSYSLVMSVRDDGRAGDPTFVYVDDVATTT
jgi:serine protease